MKALAVLDDALSAVFHDRRSFWWHVGFLFLGPFLLVLGWSDLGPEAFIDRGRGPDTFVIVTMGLGLYMIFAAGGWTLDRIPRRPGYPFSRWIRHTPVRAGDWILGRLAYHGVHSLFLIVLAAPSLVLAAEASLLSFDSALMVAAYLFLTMIGLRIAAEAARPLDKNAGSLSMLIYGVGLAAYLLSVAGAAPKWSLLRGLLRLTGPISESFLYGATGKGLLLHLGITGLGLMVVVIRLFAGRSEVPRK